MPFANKAFGNATALSRKASVLPEDASSPQRTIDMMRGKRRIRGSSIFRNASQRSVRSSSYGQMQKNSEDYATL